MFLGFEVKNTGFKLPALCSALMDLLARIIRGPLREHFVSPLLILEMLVSMILSVFFLWRSLVKSKKQSGAWQSKPIADAGVRHLLLEAGPAEFVSTPDGVSSIFHQVNEHG